MHKAISIERIFKYGLAALRLNIEIKEVLKITGDLLDF